MSTDWGPNDGTLRCVYIGLLVLRACSAFLGKGYIHPDEHFQNGEIMAGDFLGLHTLRTWEWNVSFPMRSIVPLWTTTGIPYFLLQRTGRGHLHPQTLFLLERATFLLLSILLDLSVYILVPYPRRRLLALNLLASSYVVHTYQTRPFSNSTEAVLVALSLACGCALLARNPSMSVWQGNMRDKALRPLIYLTILCIVGISTRVTFIAFASPIAVEVFSWLLNLGKTGRPLSSVLRLVSMSLATAVISAALVVAADSAYFHPDRDDSYVITPLNFLRYNLSSENLAEHGLHPRWLHVAVNLPMIIGPGLLYYAVLATSEVLQYAWAEHSQASNVLHKINKTCIYMVLASLAIMSVQPHQEPRFLIPLLVPIIVLVSNSGYLARTGKLFWVTWIIINVALALLFGVLHQGGVVPSLLYLHDEVIRAIDTTETFDRPVAAIFYWKTYMPPRRFLGVFERDVSEGLFHISDHASSPPSTLLQHIVHSRGTQSTILVMPVHAFDLIPREVHNCFHIRRKVFPHLDLDNIAESMAIGGKDGMSLGIYNVDTSCLASWEFDVRDPIVDHR